MTINASDVRELTVNELDTVSGGVDTEAFRVTFFGYGLAFGAGDGMVCVTTITPDEENTVCVGTSKPA